MSLVAPIPSWTAAGVLPPIRPGTAAHGFDRSPYPASLDEVISRFGATRERCEILDGFLKYRAALHALGFTQGFQWLDGSFMEDVETNESRAPRDVDVVTFYSPPNRMISEAQSSSFFDPRQTKPAFHVDAYGAQLGSQSNLFFVRRVAYWYSMWAHRRDGVWKGFVQVDLSPSQDAQARANLDLAIQEWRQS